MEYANFYVLAIQAVINWQNQHHCDSWFWDPGAYPSRVKVLLGHWRN
jgi:hypothetical protein